MLELFFFLQTCVVYALPSVIPSPTLSSEHRVIPLEPTPAPEWRHDLVRRDLDPSICGWLDGKSDENFHCNNAGATCLWNSTNKFVGCGNAETLNFVTSCIDFTSTNTCDSACQMSNPSVSYCPSDLPYCSTVLFPDSYSMIPCGSVKGTRTAELTIDGQKTTANLPRFLVGGVVVVTMPASMTATSSSASPSATYIDPDGGRVNTGSIVAAAIGGGVLLLGLPFGIKMFLRKRKWKKAQRPRRLQEREMRRQWAETGNPYAEQEITVEPAGGGSNFLFSQDWHGGRSKTGGSGSTTNYEMQSNR